MSGKFLYLLIHFKVLLLTKMGGDDDMQNVF